ncbi:MAG: methyltransferase domain-containing protein [Deltaproteobacteria bacterium]|nr:methyltransferase domain-containing protein [Deltaproteobacteria bacterium]
MDWSIIQQSRDLAKGRFPRALKLPIVPDQFTLILKSLKADTKVLDIGANDRRLEKVIWENFGAIHYKSLDADRRLPHDYYDFEEITEKFNLIACLDVVEHLEPDVVFQLLAKAFHRLDDPGTMFVSTPNVFHPTWLRRDCTHRTYFHYDELAGMLLSVGFKQIQVFRIGRLDWKGRLAYPFYKPLLKMLDLDYATSIMIRAEK